MTANAMGGSFGNGTRMKKVSMSAVRPEKVSRNKHTTARRRVGGFCDVPSNAAMILYCKYSATVRAFIHRPSRISTVCTSS